MKFFVMISLLLNVSFGASSYSEQEEEAVIFHETEDTEIRVCFDVIDNVRVRHFVFGYSDYGSFHVMHPSKGEKLKHLGKHKVVTLDADGFVVGIKWKDKKLRSTINWDAVHALTRLRWLSLIGNQLSGSVDLTKLPQKLEMLHLNDNHFSGSLDLTVLPRTLRELKLEHNDLDGSLVLTQLPRTLELLHLSDNAFFGFVNISKLPETMSHLQLHNNHLTRVGQGGLRKRAPRIACTLYKQQTNPLQNKYD